MATTTVPYTTLFRSLDTSAHFGLGFSHYATVTSPIRRYHDYHNHLAIKAILNGKSDVTIDETAVQALQEQLIQGRQACRQQEQWLMCEYYADKNGSRSEERRVGKGRTTQRST